MATKHLQNIPPWIFIIRNRLRAKLFTVFWFVFSQAGQRKIHFVANVLLFLYFAKAVRLFFSNAKNTKTRKINGLHQ